MNRAVNTAPDAPEPGANFCRVDCVVYAGRPYIVQGASLVSSLGSIADTGGSQRRKEHPDGRTWGWYGGNLGREQTHNINGHALISQFVNEALRSAGFSSNPLPTVNGTLSIEPRLPALLEAAQVQSDANRVRWKNAGLAEHASVGSFAKLCLELLVAGAPPRLLRLAIAAQEEELLHAHIALSFAGFGKSDAPLLLDEHAAPRRDSRLRFPEHGLEVKVDPSAMRAAAIHEGIKGEGQSALKLLKEALDALRDGASDDRRAFGELVWAMGVDEARHASLASEIVEWLQGDTAQLPPGVALRNGVVEVTEL